MSNKHEELVEEIAHDLAFRYDKDGNVVLDRERARFLISRILSAVRDGLELPGEVGRCKAGLGEFTPMVTWAHGIWKEGLLTTDHETTTFIALSGTSQGDPVGGKEEEK